MEKITFSKEAKEVLISLGCRASSLLIQQDKVLDTFSHVHIEDKKIKVIEKGKPFKSWGDIKTEIKPGRFVNKVLAVDNTEVEIFVNCLKDYFEDKTFKIFRGDSTNTVYNDKLYASYEGGLRDSCMNWCKVGEDRTEWYNNQKNIQSVAMLDSSGMIIARALLWRGLDEYGSKGNKYDMLDRVYGIKEHHTVSMWKWAISRGYIVRVSDTSFYTSIEELEAREYKHIRLTYELEIDVEECMPYIDSMYIYENSVLAYATTLKNFGCGAEIREHESGYWDRAGMVQLDNGDWVDEDDARYCDVDDVYYHYDEVYYVEVDHIYAHGTHCVYSEHENGHILLDNSTRLHDGAYCHDDNAVMLHDGDYCYEPEGICIDVGDSQGDYALPDDIVQDYRNDNILFSEARYCEEDGEYVHEDEYDDYMEDREDD